MEMVEVYRSEEGLFHCSNFLITEALNESIMDAVDVLNPCLQSLPSSKKMIRFTAP